MAQTICVRFNAIAVENIFRKTAIPLSSTNPAPRSSCHVVLLFVGYFSSIFMSASLSVRRFHVVQFTFPFAEKQGKVLHRENNVCVFGCNFFFSLLGLNFFVGCFLFFYSFHSRERYAEERNVSVRYGHCDTIISSTTVKVPVFLFIALQIFNFPKEENFCFSLMVMFAQFQFPPVPLT